MAKVHFFYSTMNAGKSTALLQSNHNYKESNLKTLLFCSKIYSGQIKWQNSIKNWAGG